MKRIVTLMVVLTSLCLCASAQTSAPAKTPAVSSADNPSAVSVRSDWAARQMEWFETLRYSRERVAFQRPFAWGTGAYNGMAFEWFAFSNTDALLQINFSIAISATDREKIVAIRDNEHRAWEVNTKDLTGYGPGTAMWVGLTNDWMKPFCNETYTRCNNRGVIDQYLGVINSKLGLRMKVHEYLQ